MARKQDRKRARFKQQHASCEAEGKRTPSSTNDPEWYAINPDLLRDAASIPFSQAAGTQYQVVPGSPEAVPGIMVLKTIPCFSDIASPSAPINIAATATYSFVRHANSGSANYDSPDLMIYIAAIAQIYSYINYLQRMYGVMNLYSHANRYLPAALIHAMGAHFDSLQQSLANFRYGINTLIYKAASLACPATMTYFRRLAFLFSGIYSEGESVKSQLYMYVPEFFMQYSETESQSGGSLKPLLFPATYMSCEQLIEYGNQLLDPILSSEDMNIMSGDILKAYGDNILKLAPLDSNYMVIPVTDLNVLEQMQNADLIGPIYRAAIEQVLGSDSNASGPYLDARVELLFNYNPAFPMHSNAAIKSAMTNHMLTTILTQPGPADVIERTRGMVTFSVYTDSDNHEHYVVRSGSDICTFAKLYRFEYDADLKAWALKDYQLETVNVVPDTDTLVSGVTRLAVYTKWQKLHCMLENFKFHPRQMYFVESQQEQEGGKPPIVTHNYLNMALDIDNYAIISEIDLNRMNEAAMLSLLSVPSIGRF